MAETEPLLSVSGLNAYYGRAHVLQDVSFEVRRGARRRHRPKRNGQDDALQRDRRDSARARRGLRPFAGEELVGRPFLQDHAGRDRLRARRAAASSPPSRPTSTCGWSAGRSGRWTIDTVYELFPRLAERKKVSGTQLSGGEQQMLAIGRALLLNPRLLIMDEPSEGLAPTIVENLSRPVRTWSSKGIGLLLIEQNLGVATSVCERQLVMVGGHIEAETTAERLASDPEEQRRWLGVEPLEAANVLALARRQQHDVHLAGAVHAHGQRLLDVGAPARARHDRERARQRVADRGEELGKAGEDQILAQERDVDGGQERPGARFLGRGREDDAARVREPVDRLGRLGALERGRDAAVHVEAGLLGARDEASTSSLSGRRTSAGAKRGSSRPRAQTRPGPASVANGWPRRASRVESR